MRHTVDFSPARHRAIARWALDASEELGEKVTNQRLHDGLAHLMLTDELTSRKLKQLLRGDA